MHGSVPQSNIAVVDGHGGSLDAVDRGGVLRLLHERGVVLFRGFRADGDAFKALTQRFCRRFLAHGAQAYRPARQGDDTVVGVLAGNNSVALHAEMNYAPLRPDLLWFHCTQPAAAGGETIIADSRRVLAALSKETRDVFEQRRVRYRILMEAPDWQRVMKIKRRAAVLAILNLLRDVRARAVGTDAIEMDFTADAIRRTGRRGEPGFINSIENVLEYGRDVTFDDGEPIPSSVVADIGRAGQSCAEPIHWEAQDMAMIDNSRILHGRRGFAGSGRLIDVRFGMFARSVQAELWANALLARVQRAVQ